MISLWWPILIYFYVTEYNTYCSCILKRCDHLECLYIGNVPMVFSHASFDTTSAFEPSIAFDASAISDINVLLETTKWRIYFFNHTTCGWLCIFSALWYFLHWNKTQPFRFILLLWLWFPNHSVVELCRFVNISPMRYKTINCIKGQIVFT